MNALLAKSPRSVLFNGVLASSTFAGPSAWSLRCCVRDRTGQKSAGWEGCVGNPPQRSDSPTVPPSDLFVAFEDRATRHPALMAIAWHFGAAHYTFRANGGTRPVRHRKVCQRAPPTSSLASVAYPTVLPQSQACRKAESRSLPSKTLRLPDHRSPYLPLRIAEAARGTSRSISPYAAARGRHGTPRSAPYTYSPREAYRRHRMEGDSSGPPHSRYLRAAPAWLSSSPMAAALR